MDLIRSRGYLPVDLGGASSISYITGWSHTDPAVLPAAATNVLRAVNTTASGLDDQDDEDIEESSAA